MNGKSSCDSRERAFSTTSSLSKSEVMSLDDTVESGNVTSCFICDDKFEDKGCVPLSIGCTSYSNTRLPTKIGQLMGDDIMVVIARDDMLCKRCTALLNHLDKLEKDMGVVQKALRGYLNRKYKLLDSEDDNIDEESGTRKVEEPENGDVSQPPTCMKSDSEDKLLHKCASCEYKTSFPAMLKSHLLRCRSRQLWYRCSMCDKKFPSEKHARQHIMAAHLSNWPCHYCGANFSEENDYTTHMKTHVSSVTSQSQPEQTTTNDNDATNYYCNLCTFHTTESGLLDEHMGSHAPNVFTCSNCNDSFENEDDYSVHLKSHKSCDDDDADDSFGCHFCLSTFPSRDELEAHLEIHNVGEEIETLQEDVEERKYDMALSLEDINDCVVPTNGENSGGDLILSNTLSVDYYFCNICSLAFDNEMLLIEHNKLHSDDQHTPLDKVVIGCDYTEINEHLEEMFKSINSEKKSESNKDTSETNDLNECIVPDDEKQSYQYSENCDPSEQESLFLLSNSDFINEQQIDSSKECSLKIPNSSEMLSIQDKGDILTNSPSPVNDNQNEHRVNTIFEMVRMKKLSSVKLDTTEMPLLLGTLGKYPVTSSVDNTPPEASNEDNTYIDLKTEDVDLCLDQSEANRMFVCIICSYETSDTIDLQNHVKIHDSKELGLHVCAVCNKEFLSSISLENHTKSHHNASQKATRTCPYCLSVFVDGSQLKQHLQEAHPKDKQSHSCVFCCKPFPTKKALRVHEETHSERANSAKFACEVCSQTFQREKQLKDHMALIHRDPHCRFCGKEIHKAKTLKFHELRHIRNKGSYDCDVCARKFKTRTGLTHHKAAHTGDYKYRCSFCGNGFMSRMMLEEHRSKHTKEERYVCDICGKKFGFQSTYWIHRKWHDNPYPYKCSYCDRMFRHSSLLAVHRRKHTGERPYKCLHCPMTFTVGGTLKRHMILHTGKYPFTCDECKRGFTTKHKYAAHMSKSHGVHDLLQSQPQQPCQYKMVIPEPAVDSLEPRMELVDWDDCGAIVLQGSEEMVPCTIIGDSILVDDMAQRVVEIVMDDTSRSGAGVTLGDDASMLSADLWSYQ